MEKERANLGFCYKVEHRNVTVARGGYRVKDIYFFKVEI